MLAIVQSRFNSKRLPGKALTQVGNRTILGRTIDRLRNSSQLDSIIIATSDLMSDEVIVDHGLELSTEVFRGSLDDVGQRLLHASLNHKVEAFVRISGDSPFIDWRIVDHAIALYENEKPDLVSNVFHRTFPKGQSVEIIKTQSLAQICQSDRTAEEKEHVSSLFYSDFEKFRIISFTSGSDSGSSRQCIDDANDLRRSQQLVSNHQTDKMTWREIDFLLNRKSL